MSRRIPPRGNARDARYGVVIHLASVRTDDDPAPRPTAAPSAEALDAVQARTLRVLAVGQVAGSAALGAAVTVGAFVVQDLLGEETPWAGLAAATVTVGTAVAAQVLSRRMSRRGRRPGLAMGYLAATLGAIVAALGVEADSLAVFLAGLFVFGSAQAANLLSRYAATDLARPDQRARAMSRIVFASTAGAVLGPSLIGAFEAAGQAWFGLHRYTGPWLFSAMFLALAMTNVAVRLRPDPLVLAGGLAASTDERIPLRHTFGVVRSDGSARLAVTAMAVSQATMVAVMAMTPVHLKLHGHEEVSPFVVSLHIAGMYAFSPLVGRYADRYGRQATIAIGAALLLAAAGISSLSGDVEQLLFPSLWLLGLGWSFGLIGGSSLLVDSVPPDEQVSVQGAADLLMSLCGGLAGFASGFVRRAVGFHVLAALAMLAAGWLLATTLATRRKVVALHRTTTEPGAKMAG
jgi:MFS family permease